METDHNETHPFGQWRPALDGGLPDEEPEGRVIGKDSEAEIKGAVTGIAAMRQEAYDRGFAAGRRNQAPRSFEQGVEVGKAAANVEFASEQATITEQIQEKRWAIDSSGRVVMEKETFDSMRVALNSAWESFVKRFRECLEKTDISKPEQLSMAEHRVVEYMRNWGYAATIDGVIRAMRGEKE